MDEIFGIKQNRERERKERELCPGLELKQQWYKDPPGYTLVMARKLGWVLDRGERRATQLPGSKGTFECYSMLDTPMHGQAGASSEVAHSLCYRKAQEKLAQKVMGGESAIMQKSPCTETWLSCPSPPTPAYLSEVSEEYLHLSLSQI